MVTDLYLITLFVICPAAYGKRAFVYGSFISKWKEEDVERLMQIYWEMKAKSDKNDWKYVSKKLDIGFTRNHCRKKVMTVLKAKEKEKRRQIAKDAQQCPSQSAETSAPATMTSELLPDTKMTSKYQIFFFLVNLCFMISFVALTFFSLLIKAVNISGLKLFKRCNTRMSASTLSYKFDWFVVIYIIFNNISGHIF